MTDRDTDFFKPVSALEAPRYTGVPTFMRLPNVPLDHPKIDQVDIGLVGVPWDAGTTNRPGARHGPRQLRDASTMIRAMRVDDVSHAPSFQPKTTAPFELANCADLGDVSANPTDIPQAVEDIARYYAQLAAKGIAPLTAGGDHLVSLPVLKGLAEGVGAPFGMIHFDAHTDLFDSYFGGNKLTHGTPFRRAIEAGYLDPKRVVQIGIRGTAYDTSDIDWALEQGITIIRIERLMAVEPRDIMHMAREIVGDAPTYCSFDIDVIDPAFAPGTGTPEIGGITSFQAQQLCRGLHGLNLIGADLVEVSPPFDPTGGTAWVGVSIMFELLCALAQSVHDRR